MKADIWMPFYIGDYLSDTMHLTTTEHGAYVLLIIDCWKKGGELPDNDRYLASVTKSLCATVSDTPSDTPSASLKLWSAMRTTLASFFTVADGKWVHRRVKRELDEAARLKHARSKGAEATNQKRHAQKASPSAPPSDTQSTTPSPSPSPSPGETEREGGAALPPPVPASKSGRKPANLAECLTAAQFIGMSEQDARDWHRDCELCDWKRGDGTVFDHWKRQLCIHRDNLASKRRADTQRGGAGPARGDRPPSILDLKTVLQAKQARMDELKGKHFRDLPMNPSWDDQGAKEVYLLLRKEVRELSIRLSQSA